MEDSVLRANLKSTFSAARIDLANRVRDGIKAGKSKLLVFLIGEDGLPVSGLGNPWLWAIADYKQSPDSPPGTHNAPGGHAVDLVEVCKKRGVAYIMVGGTGGCGHESCSIQFASKVRSDVARLGRITTLDYVKVQTLESEPQFLVPLGEWGDDIVFERAPAEIEEPETWARAHRERVAARRNAKDAEEM